MILVFGGAYQGKKEYAQKCLGVKEIFDCEKGAPDFQYDGIGNIEAFAMECVKKGIEPKSYFEENREKWQEKVLIMTDVSQGVVPIDPEVRAYREANSRLMLYLARQADRVIRVFCGIGKDIK